MFKKIPTLRLYIFAFFSKGDLIGTIDYFISQGIYKAKWFDFLILLSFLDYPFYGSCISFWNSNLLVLK